jgi:mono/diheme cytochrome c family protein
LILFLVHIKMQLDLFERFGFLFKKLFGKAAILAPNTRIAGGLGRVRTPGKHFSAYPALIAGLIGIVCLGILSSPSNGRAGNIAAPGAASLGALVHRVHALRSAASLPAAGQDAGQVAPPATAPAAPKPVELPEGDGKPIATEYCQMCHKLTNLTKAHKNLDDWKDTIATMIERGASIPDDKVDTLAKYLAANFGPKDAAPAASAQAATPAAPAASSDPPATSAPAAAKAIVELPDGDGKAIATENCQACHKLTNLTKAHKSLDDWKETVQTMIDRGANVPAEQVDTLVQYLAKNFGPKDASAPASVATPASTPAQ